LVKVTTVNDDRTRYRFYLLSLSISPSHASCPRSPLQTGQGTPGRPNGAFVYSEIWMYADNHDYSIPLDYIFEIIPPTFISNGIAHNLIILGALLAGSWITSAMHVVRFSLRLRCFCIWRFPLKTKYSLRSSGVGMHDTRIWSFEYRRNWTAMN